MNLFGENSGQGHMTKIAKWLWMLFHPENLSRFVLLSSSLDRSSNLEASEPWTTINAESFSPIALNKVRSS